MSMLPSAEYFLYLGGFFILTFFVLYQRKASILSPVSFFLMFYGLVFILSFIYHLLVPPSHRYNFYLLDNISWKSFWISHLVFLKMLFFYTLGVFIYVFHTKNVQRLHKQKVELIFKPLNSSSFQNKLEVVLIFLIFTAILLTFFDLGWEIFERKKYIPYKKSYLRTIYQVLYLGVAFIAGILYNRSKLLSLISLFFSLFFMLSVGSRFATINLLAFFLGVILTEKNIQRRFWIGVFAGLVVFLFFGLNLGLRSESRGGHGTIPYLLAVWEKPLFFLDYALENAYYTIIFGFYVTRRTIFEYEPNLDWLLISLSPLPGSLTQWNEIAHKFRINIYCPFNAIGELAVYKVFFETYFFLIGIYFAFIDLKIKKLIAKNNFFFAILLFSLLALFTIFSFEYNLRSSHRYIYYSIVVLLISSLIGKIKIIKTP